MVAAAAFPHPSQVLGTSHSFSLLCSSGSKAPNRFECRAGKHLFLSRLDYAPMFLPPYFLLSFCALCSRYTSDQSRRKNMLSVFLSLCLPDLHPSSPYVQKGERRRILFNRMSGVRRGMSSLKHSPTYWPQHFLPFHLTALSSTLGKKIGKAHRQGDKVEEAII